MLLLLLNYVVLRALWKIDVHLISTVVNKGLYYYYYYYYYIIIRAMHFIMQPTVNESTLRRAVVCAPLL